MAEEPKKSPLGEITQPFVDLWNAPRALWGINLAYLLEGMVYFGMLGYLAIYCSDFVFQAIDGADEAAHYMVMVLTAGITIAMFFLGVVADKRGVRFALITAFVFMLVGRCIWAGGPNLLGLEPVRPGVMSGDKVSLYVSELETRHGVKAISDAMLIGSEQDAVDADEKLAIDLSAGDGIAPSEELESRLVSLSKAKIVGGEEALWDIEYGSTPVKARLFLHAAEELGICKGAVISLNQAYISTVKDKDDKDKWEYVVRANWVEDVSSVDKSECEDAEEVKEAEEGISEEDLRSKERWAVTIPTPKMEEAPEVSLSDLRAMDDGSVGVILRDVYVTYVRNGGYFLQAERDGAAIFAFVSPFWSPLQIATLVGMLLVVIGYGMYQPAAYAAVRKFTTPKTAAMGFAMLYALMNLGGWLPSFAFLIRSRDYADLGISGAYWVYAGFTLVALLATVFILTARTVKKAEAEAKESTDTAESEKGTNKPDEPSKEDVGRRNNADELDSRKMKPHMLLFWIGAIVLFLFKGESPWFHTWDEALWRWVMAGVVFIFPMVTMIVPELRNWIAKHPLEDPKFAFFIFALIPVQTLFTYNWLILPQYINRAFEGWIGAKFEIAANANPLLIFVAVPIITALTQKAKVYNMMILGTFIMAAPAFLLAVGPYWWTLFPYLLIMTIGEAMWQPRFLQYAAEIAPEGRTGEYMGVAQLPWFLTKVLVPLLYSGRMMDTYCPAEGTRDTQTMWLIFACIAMCSTVFLILAKGWVGKDFKTKAD